MRKSESRDQTYGGSVAHIEVYNEWIAAAFDRTGFTFTRLRVNSSFTHTLVMELGGTVQKSRKHFMQSNLVQTTHG